MKGNNFANVKNQIVQAEEVRQSLHQLEPRPSKEPKSAKERKSVQAKPEVKPRGHHASKAKGISGVPWKNEHELTDSLLTIELNGPHHQAFSFTKGDLDNAGNTTSQTQDAHCKHLALKILINTILLVAGKTWTERTWSPLCAAASPCSKATTRSTRDREEELYGDPPYGAGNLSGCATPYSTLNASSFDSGKGLSLSHNNTDVLFCMYNTINTTLPPFPSMYPSTYNTQSNASYKLPPSSLSAT
ncbi:hypothetical protein K438DRAFT_1993335 [Mycena galopus ATCC 62051]|nr:hypothetical protein K438DRAFT_1993335 [Mycena galopus ATCC 62051]